MGGLRKRQDEESAARLVACHCGIPVKVVSRSVAHDYDLVGAGGRIIALEVTQAVSAPVVAAARALANNEWRTEKIGCHWHLSLTATLRVKRLQDEVEDLLVVLEGLRVFTIDCARMDPDLVGSSSALREVATSLARLGVRTATGWPGTEPLITTGASSAGSTAPDLVNAVLEAEAWKSDNLRKLTHAHAAEKHLFVWVGSSKEQASAALAIGFVPGPPNLPSVVTTAWVGLPGEDWCARRLWRTTPPGGWQIIC